jgi:branched-chain amino acid transport system substrate-binding protein
MTQGFYHIRSSLMASLFLLSVASCTSRPDVYDVPEAPAPVVQPHPYTQAPASAPAEVTADAPKRAKKPAVAFNGTEIKAALLLPLSGESAAIGKPMLDAAMLALFDKYSASSQSPVRIALMPKDTRGSAEYATKAAQDAIAEGAQIIIGPVFSDDVREVTKIAQPKNIPVISFSNNKNATDTGAYLFGFMPDNQIDAIAEYSVQQGVTTIALLLPDTDYGRLAEELITSAAAEHGMNIVYAQRYNPDASILARDVQLFANKMKHAKVTLQGIFLAEQGETLDILMKNLNRHGFSPDAVQYIGTGLWDDPALAASNIVNKGWFASSPPSYFSAFNARFSQAEGYEAPRLASLAYDAVALVATLADSDGFSGESITQPTGFIGPANGLFRLRKNGTIERELSIMALENGKIVEKAPAKRMFY